MKMIKSLILSSAAGLLAMSAAQAADLPVKAKAVEYVRICSLYGAGFFYIPGTDTCVKLGGYLRVDVAMNSFDFVGYYNGNAGQGNRLRNYYNTRSREDLNIDTRTATEYGVLRTYWDATFSWSGGGDVIAGGFLGVYHAFIQFAGFTMGKTISQFDVPWVNYPANTYDGLVGGSGQVTGVPMLAYTADFGNGVSGTLSAEDQFAHFQTNIYNTSFATAGGIGTGVYGAPSIGGLVAPDLIGMLRVDQAWGLFQASVAAHDNHASYYIPGAEVFGHPTDKWGWAGQLGLSIKNIPTGPGDTINVTAGYSNGASRYIFQSLVPTSFAMYGSTALGGAYQSLAFAGVTDAVFGVGTGLETTTAYGFRGGYTHNWNANWNSSIYGAWAAMQYSGNGKALVCAPIIPLLTAGAAGCNPDFSLGQVGVKTAWTPVKNLTFSGDLVYSDLHQKYAGAIALPPIGTKPGSLYEFKDQSTWSFLARAQRVW
jgi:hypothetical protein